MAASAFTRFDPSAFLKGRAAKVAKIAKVSPKRRRTFATFATFAEAPPQEPSAAPTADAWTGAQDERAAIIEHDGGAPREWAEALARLDTGKPPADVPPRRWVTFVNDCGRFVDEGWAARAEILGWGPLDLFGCDRKRPFARVDRMGLLWLVNGCTVIELHRDRAVIKTVTGARQTYRRHPVDLGQIVLAWELAPL